MSIVKSIKKEESLEESSSAPTVDECPSAVTPRRRRPHPNDGRRCRDDASAAARRRRRDHDDAGRKKRHGQRRVFVSARRQIGRRQAAGHHQTPVAAVRADVRAIRDELRHADRGGRGTRHEQQREPVDAERSVPSYTFSLQCTHVMERSRGFLSLTV